MFVVVLGYPQKQGMVLFMSKHAKDVVESSIQHIEHQGLVRASLVHAVSVEI